MTDARTDSDGTCAVTVRFLTRQLALCPIRYRPSKRRAPWDSAAEISAATRHVAGLTGLAKSQPYSYRVYSGGKQDAQALCASRQFHTTRRADETFRLAFYSDSHRRNAIHRGIAWAVSTSGAEIALHGGDMTDNGECDGFKRYHLTRSRSPRPQAVIARG